MVGAQHKIQRAKKKKTLGEWSNQKSERTLLSPVFSFTIFHALPQVTEHLGETKYLDESSKYESWWSIFDELQGEKIEIIFKKSGKSLLN